MVAGWPDIIRYSHLCTLDLHPGLARIFSPTISKPGRSKRTWHGPCFHRPMLRMHPPQNRTGGCRVDWPFSEVDGFERYVNGFTRLKCALEKMDRNTTLSKRRIRKERECWVGNAWRCLGTFCGVFARVSSTTYICTNYHQFISCQWKERWNASTKSWAVYARSWTGHRWLTSLQKSLLKRDCARSISDAQPLHTNCRNMQLHNLYCTKWMAL